MNLKPRFLIKNCYYIVPSPSTALLMYFKRTVNQPSYRKEWQAVSSIYRIYYTIVQVSFAFSRFTYLLFSSLKNIFNEIDSLIFLQLSKMCFQFHIPVKLLQK